VHTQKTVTLIKIGFSKTCIKVSTDTHISDAFPISIGLKQGNALSPFRFTFTSEYDPERPKKSQGTGNEWDTSASGIC
jgi:hypothetical protein